MDKDKGFKSEAASVISITYIYMLEDHKDKIVSDQNEALSKSVWNVWLITIFKIW